MDLKKILCIILAAVSVTCAAASCGEEKSEDNGGNTAQTQTESADAAAVADKLKSDIAFEDDLVEFDSGKIEKILGVAPDAYKKAKVYVSATGATPEEIACFEANDKMADVIKASLETRLTNQKNTFTDYKPEQAPKLDSAVIVVKDNCVYYCVSGDSAKAKEIIG
ncbi:DUF4358 domain-containing protein [uncultured Ruminococcus sp.]|uniref:DUF4358 domain-containing protein n=1 Tax=uncultured Ruminococcus sp. TaxID=165186 RepID=UPI000EF0F289|nr:DUF4358 domain-containing protein [uncultured Ruminococcus sp.]HCJ42035.1 hypothetical protein [Ruminococcus sp.]